MRRIALLAVPLLLAACAAAPPDTVPDYPIPPGPREAPPAAAMPASPEASEASALPRLGPLIAPTAPGDYGRGAATVAPLPVTPAPPPPANAGPVTGYGTGGMQQMPGAPPNPPYTGRGFAPGQ